MSNPIFHPIYLASLAERMQLPQLFTNPFCYQPHSLCLKAKTEMCALLGAHADWVEELNKGKMLGVMVVRDAAGTLGWLGAYSGQLCERADWDDFVPNIYDYLSPDGYFKTEERNISLVNQEIRKIQISDEYQSARNRLNEVVAENQRMLAEAKEKAKVSKQQRDAVRVAGTDAKTALRLIAESQFEKAELKRLKQKLSARETEAKILFSTFETKIADKKKERECRSIALQTWLFEHFVLYNAKGESKNLIDIFADTPQQIPPSGAGECCAPKLLQYAYLHHLLPLCMMEWWWGASPKKEIRLDGQFYPACSSKCGPVLGWMLQGLSVEQNVQELRAQTLQSIRVVYEDNWLMVVDKPSGMLSVPGKIEAPSVFSMVRTMRPEAEGPLIVHRLDMDTSGLMLVAKDKETHRLLQAQFDDHSIEKRYMALLEGVVSAKNMVEKMVLGKKKNVGVIDLPLCPDITDRPRQMVNYEFGKRAVTFFEVVKVCNGRTLVNYYPQTGRTHQLRVHSAHKDGLSCPIVGDELYGNRADKLHLRAVEISFWHPGKMERMQICTDEQF